VSQSSVSTRSTTKPVQAVANTESRLSLLELTQTKSLVEMTARPIDHNYLSTAVTKASLGPYSY